MVVYAQGGVGGFELWKIFSIVIGNKIMTKSVNDNRFNLFFGVALLIIILFVVCYIFLLSKKNLKVSSSLTLQEMCSKGSKVFFNENYPQNPLQFVPGIDDYNSYTNHYNKKLDKCFILINDHRGSGSGDHQIISDATRLYDVYEDKEYATWFTGPQRLGEMNNTSFYNILGNACNDKDFQSFIKSYMEE